jgi:glycosyltransferase involved in cell wall biosynthesis
MNPQIPAPTKTPTSGRRALYLSHTGMTEPLGQSQVLPYLRGLVRASWRVDLVAFEPATADEEKVRALAARLGDEGIRYTWSRRRSSHHLGVKLADAAEAVGRALRRAVGARPRIVHARSYLPGAVAKLVSTLVPGARFVFDCRGLAGDEYLDTAHWTREDLRYRLVKQAERTLFGRADAVVTLTHRLRDWLRAQGLTHARSLVEVIPCCADLRRFRPDEEARSATRLRLGAGERLVLAYSGSLGSYYCDEEVAVLFGALRRRCPAQLAVFTRSDTSKLAAALAREGVSGGDVHIEAVDPKDMPARLAGADAAVSLIQPWFSKIASSPTKVAEFLGVGLPVVANPQVGDMEALINASPAMIDAGDLSRDALERAAAALVDRARRPELHREARRLAEAELDLETVGVARYQRLYESLL